MKVDVGGQLKDRSRMGCCQFGRNNLLDMEPRAFRNIDYDGTPVSGRAGKSKRAAVSSSGDGKSADG